MMIKSNKLIALPPSGNRLPNKRKAGIKACLVAKRSRVY
jgi:hypothetical protein